MSDLREALAQALRPAEPWPGAPAPEVIADALLPVVEAECRRRAAEELRAAADRLTQFRNVASLRREDYATATLYTAAREICDRADAIEGQP